MQLVSSDEEPAAQAARGDPAAFKALVKKHTPGLLAFRRHLVGSSDAEDRGQAALLRAHRHLKGFDPERRFRSWLYKIAQNRCLDANRASLTRQATRGSPRSPSGLIVFCYTRIAGSRRISVFRPAQGRPLHPGNSGP
jgi:DNA-directed RNA polymerase specialized sigma24 family protein